MINLNNIQTKINTKIKDEDLSLHKKQRLHNQLWQWVTKNQMGYLGCCFEV